MGKKKKKNRKRKRVHQQMNKVIGFQICATYGTASRILRDEIDEIGYRERVGNDGQIVARAVIEKKLKQAEKKIREIYQKPPRNMPKDANLNTGLYIKEVIKKTSKFQGSSYGNGIVSKT